MMRQKWLDYLCDEWPSLASQDGRRFISRSAAQRDRAAKKRDASGERDNHQENDKGRFGSRAKDSFSKKARQNYPERVTGSPAYESEQKFVLPQAGSPLYRSPHRVPSSSQSLCAAQSPKPPRRPYG